MVLGAQAKAADLATIFKMPEGANGATRGNGGDQRSLSKGIGGFVDKRIDHLEKNFTNNGIQHFNNAANINCEHIQSILSYGLRMIALLHHTNFTFEDLNQKPLLKTADHPSSLQKLAFGRIESEFTMVSACLDHRLHPEVDILTSEARIVIVDEPFSAYRRDLMALNFEKQGRIYIFANNWTSDRVLDDPLCHIEKSDQLLPNPDNPLYVVNGEFQLNCVFLTHLTVGTHEILAVNGVKEEQNPFVMVADDDDDSIYPFPYSSYFIELLSFNLVKPRERSIKVVQHWQNWQVQTYLGVLEKHKLVTPAMKAFLNTDRKDQAALAKAYSEYANKVCDVNIEVERLKKLYPGLMFLTKLIRPAGNGGGDAVQRFARDFVRNEFDSSVYPTALQTKIAMAGLSIEFFTNLATPDNRKTPNLDVFSKYLRTVVYVSRGVELLGQTNYARLELAMIGKESGEATYINESKRAKALMSLQEGIRQQVSRELVGLRMSDL